MTSRDPRDAEITIVGGGAIGCAVAYQLTRSGKRDVQLLERVEVASATSSRAAGLVGQVRASPERTKLAMASVATYSELERETGYSPEWRQTGSLRIALTDERVDEFRNMLSVADSVGLEVELVSASHAAELCPVIDPRTVKAALWCPTDGYLQPNSLTMAYANAARDAGATICTGTPVTGIETERGAVRRVVTQGGSFETEILINAAGPWAVKVAKMVGLELPIFPVRHEYFVSEPLAGWHPSLPVLRIPDVGLYVRAEVNGVLCGGWEPNALSIDPREMPLLAEPPIVPDWDVLSEFSSDFETLVPAVAGAGVREVFRGWPAFTPDGGFVVGPVPGIRGFVMAAGCNAHGVSGSAGLAQHLVESLLDPDPSPYVRSLSPARFLPRNWDWEEGQRRARNVYETYYALSGLAQGAPRRQGARISTPS